MNKQLWVEAEELANRPYAITVEMDSLSNGQQVYLLSHPELSGCKAYGVNLVEAHKNLEEARVDFIYALLEFGQPVPPPQTSSDVVTTSSLPNAKVYLVNASAKGGEVEHVLDSVSQPQHHHHEYSILFGGDLVKHR